MAWVAVFLSWLAFFYLATRSKPSLARRITAWAGCFVAVFVVYESVGFLRWANAKVNPLKPVFREANKNAPDFAFKLVADDSPRSLADYRGKVIVLNLWSTWCPPCRDEMPILERLHERYRKEGVVVIAVSDESTEQQSKFKEFAHMSFVKGHIDPGTRIASQSYESFERNIKPSLSAEITFLGSQRTSSEAFTQNWDSKRKTSILF